MSLVNIIVVCQDNSDKLIDMEFSEREREMVGEEDFYLNY